MTPERYRFYHRDADGVLNGPDWFSAKYDEQAIQQIQSNDPHAICEVWQGRRLVAKLSPDGDSPGERTFRMPHAVPL